MDIKNVINQYYDMVHKIAYSKTQNVNDADDLTQEVFLKYLQSDKKFDSDDHIKNWLIRVTINTYLHQISSRWNKNTTYMTDELLAHTKIINGVEYISVHPTFLYESLWNLVLLIILIAYTKHKKFDGEIFLLYLFGYGVGRFWIESLRTDQLLIPGIGYPVSMALAAVLVVVSAVWIILMRIKLKKEGSSTTFQQK